MPKLPKLSDFTDVSGLMNKVKSAIDNITSSNSTISEEALAQEKDPLKAKFLEIELLINHLHETMVAQNKIINELQTKYLAIKKLTFDTLIDKEEPQSSPDIVVPEPTTIVVPEPTTTAATKENISEVNKVPKE